MRAGRPRPKAGALPLLDAGRQPGRQGRNLRVEGRVRPRPAGRRPGLAVAVRRRSAVAAGAGERRRCREYPAECYGWFDGALAARATRTKGKSSGTALLRWADAQSVANCLTEDIQGGFPQGDDAFPSLSPPIDKARRIGESIAIMNDPTASGTAAMHAILARLTDCSCLPWKVLLETKHLYQKVSISPEETG